MTLTEFQTYLHALYRGDDNVPTDGDTKWNQREYILHSAINIWENQNVLWDELWTTLTDASTGDKTVNSSDLAYTMPTDMKFLGGYVTVTSGTQVTTYTVVKPQDISLYTSGVVYFTGNKKIGQTLHFLTQPTVGGTIDYPYYKDAFTPTTTAHVIEMSDPYFAVYYALGKLHEQEGAGDRARASYAIADEKLIKMKTANMLLPPLQPNRPNDDGRGGFGQTGSWGFSRYGQSFGQ